MITCDVSQGYGGLKDITFKMGDKEYTLTPKMYTQLRYSNGIQKSSNRMSLFGLQQIGNYRNGAKNSMRNTFILGDTFLRNFYTVYDMAKHRVGVATLKGGSGGAVGGTSAPNPWKNVNSGNKGKRCDPICSQMNSRRQKLCYYLYGDCAWGLRRSSSYSQYGWYFKGGSCSASKSCATCKDGMCGRKLQQSGGDENGGGSADGGSPNPGSGGSAGKSSKSKNGLHTCNKKTKMDASHCCCLLSATPITGMQDNDSYACKKDNKRCVADDSKCPGGCCDTMTKGHCSTMRKDYDCDSSLMKTGCYKTCCFCQTKRHSCDNMRRRLFV